MKSLHGITWVALFRLVTAFSIAGLVLASTVARADIFAATCVAGPSASGQDIAVMNASTGARVALPAVVNSADTELDPSINLGGTKLLFNLGSSTPITPRGRCVITSRCCRWMA
jgi:hypothetical protein